MPMPYDEFNWRPNDNSATTNLRYTLEAEKWVNAVSSAQRKAQPRSISGDLAFISMLLHLVFSVLLLILLGILHLVTALVRLIETSVNKRKGPGRNKDKIKLTPEAEEEKQPDAVWDIKPEKQYPKGWQLIFWTSWGRLRHIWQFLFLLVFIYLILLVVFFFLHLWLPAYFKFSTEMLIFIGAISLWNAFLGVDD